MGKGFATVDQKGSRPFASSSLAPKPHKCPLIHGMTRAPAHSGQPKPLKRTRQRRQAKAGSV